MTHRTCRPLAGALLGALVCLAGTAASADTTTTSKAINLSSLIKKGVAPPVYLDRGRVEYGILGRFHLNDPSSQDLSLRYAPMLDQHWQWGIDFSWHNNGGTEGSVGGLANYYLGDPARATRPYVGGVLGTTFGDAGDCLEYGFHGGIKHFVSPNVALGGELQWRRMGSMDWSGLLVGLSYFGGPTLALPDYNLPARHTVEYDLFADMNFDDPVSESFGFQYAPFIDENWQWGGQFNLLHTDDATTGFVGGLVNYHFRPHGEKNRLLPYVGFDLGTTFGDIEDIFSYGPHAGIKYFLTSDVALIAQYNYTMSRFAGHTDHSSDIRLGFGYFRP